MNDTAAGQQGGNLALPIICFHHGVSENEYLSNWYPAAFDLAGKHYVSAEQFIACMQVSLFGRDDLATKIMATEDPATMQTIANTHFPEFVQGVWARVIRPITVVGMQAKFAQNPELHDQLIGTGNALLACCAGNDAKWGIGLDITDGRRYNPRRWDGTNLLGIILMTIRERLHRDDLAGITSWKDAYHADPIDEWCMPAGALRKLPIYHSAVHCYADTLNGYELQQSFYWDHTLAEWEQLMDKPDCPLPRCGFFEAKQSIYNLARRSL